MRRISCALLMAAVVGCSDEARITQPLDRTQSPEVLAKQAPTAEYTIVKLTSSLGGTVSRGSGINNRGWVVGFSNLPGDQIRHATLWRDGAIIDLGTLGGEKSSSNVQWPGVSDRGMIAGISQTAIPDPLKEDWSCSAFLPVTGTTCLGFVWDDGVMKPLPTLGGNNGFAAGVNNRGQVVGWAETLVHDPTCNAPQVLQFRAVMWEPRKRGSKIRELPPFRGDSTSAATAINDRGQTVGISGDCDVAVGRFSARHAVLWERGRVKEIPNLGGTSWHTPMDINEAGDVVGFSNPAGDAGGIFIARAFLWTGGRKSRDLGVLRGDATSQARGINSRRQVVGVSTGTNGNRAFLWEDGVMKDLNTLVGPGFSDQLVSAQHINEAGAITGTLLESSTGKTLTFVAVPKAVTP
ncbi:MAG: hypothetical protein ACREON_16185 [Gemmatimonadaceae bacterium]